MRPRAIVAALAVVALAALSLFAFSDLALIHIAEWMVYACLPACNGFVLVYGLRFPWYRSQIGRALMTKAVGVMALFNLSAAAQAFDYQVPSEVGVLVVGLVVFGVWYQFLTLVSTSLNPDRKEVS